MVKELNFTKSWKLMIESRKYIPTGSSSRARLWKNICHDYLPCSLFIKKASGSYIYDVDGNKYIDYRLGFGPVILGHDFHAVNNAVEKALHNGQVYAFNNEMEIEVAKLIKSMVPCAERVRYCNSGTESTLLALRIGRAFTGKDKIIKFEGHYHGWHDFVLFSTDPFSHKEQKGIMQDSKGIPKVVKPTVFIAEWNDFEGISKLIKDHHREIGALICEPVMGNSGSIPPKPGFLQLLKKLCKIYNIVLIFDEVKTGFRVARGGAQELYGVCPDLACFAKALGNGYPVAAVVGKKELMQLVETGEVFHGGTYAANPISMVASREVLGILKKKDVYKYLNWYGKEMMNGMQDIFKDRNVDGIVQGLPSMFQFFFTPLKEFIDYKGLENINEKLFAKVQFELLKRGVMIDEDNYEPIYNSFSHKVTDLRKTLEAFDGVVKILK